MDKVIIKNLRVRGILGIYDWERNRKREILINVTLYTNTRVASKSDSIDDCVNYQPIAEKLRSYTKTAARMTVEALTEDLANICLNESGVMKVTVRVEKPGAIKGSESVGIEIERP
ncbi:MAG: dihydroneopterin aldolase [Anaerolineales bacterium]|nr:dihydroneopterin aldolase [Anaerolineales bacterium]